MIGDAASLGKRALHGYFHPMRPDKKPKMLYRKVNTRARGVWHNSGGDYRHQRNTKDEKRAIADEVAHGSMHIKDQRGKAGAKTRRGLDYTPLYRFLLSKVGQDWAPVEKEAIARIDDPERLYGMVAVEPGEDEPVFLCCENSYFQRLYVDAAGKLAFLDPNVTIDRMWPTCECCTHTLNGEPFVNPWIWGAYEVYYPDAPPTRSE